VDGTTHPDLFWAIRGGGGNFGVATRFQFRLHELPSIVGGVLLLPATADVISSFVAEADAAPAELTTIANIMPAPPLPFVPAEHHGKLVMMGFMVYAGATEPGERAIAPFRALATPLADTVRPMSYGEMFPPDPGEYHPVAVARTMYVDTVDRKMAETIVDHLRRSSAKMPATQLRVLGGAASLVPVDATAYAHRARRCIVTVAGLYESADETPQHESWLDHFVEAVNPADNAAYVNFIGDEGDARVRDAYPAATWNRLSAIKRKYDPTNLFRINQNVPPVPERS
jgi:FAD/FMN-containing dehydrogenase